MKITAAVFIAIYLLCSACPLRAERAPLVYNSCFYLAAQNVHGFSAQSFFDDYKKYDRGIENQLNISWAIETGIKMQFSKLFRYGLCISTMKGQFQDEYDYEIVVGENKFGRYHLQEFEFLNAPVLLTAEYIPYSDSQFRNYYGLGGGVSVYEIKWKETVRSTKPGIDKREGKYNTTENGLAPTLRIFAGTELQFDKEWYEKFFTASLKFEAEYTYAFRNVDIFRNVKKGLPDPSVLKDNYSMFPGYLGLSVILSFNFNKVNFLDSSSTI